MRVVCAAAAALVIFTAQIRFPAQLAAALEPPAGGEEVPNLVEDFTYVCTFKTPTASGSGSASPPPEGMFAGRRVDGDGDLRFYHKSGSSLVEFSYPETCNSSTVVTATMVNNWGNVWSGKTKNSSNGAITNLEYGQLFYDSVSEGLFTLYFDNYNTDGHSDPQIIFTKLNDPDTDAFDSYTFRAAPKSQRSGRFMARNPNQTWADTYTNGNTLMIGHIGVQSGNGFSSWGPTLMALETDIDETLPAFPTTSSITVQTLLNYPINPHSSRAPNPAADWTIHDTDTDEVGKWHQGDGYDGTGVWIKSDTMEGVLFAGSHGAGHVWYGLYADYNNIPNPITDLVFTSGTPATISSASGAFATSGWTTLDGQNLVISGTTGGLNDKTVDTASITSTLITLATGETLVSQGPNAPAVMYIRGCGHNKTDPGGVGATGPHSETRDPFWYIYDIAELARVSLGTIEVHEAEWDNAVNSRDLGGSFNTTSRQNGAYWDSVDERLYVAIKKIGGAYTYASGINVYQLNDGTAPGPASQPKPQPAPASQWPMPVAAFAAVWALGGLLTRRVA